MRLNKLLINGFKSFARKTEIDFENGITAIIGPNGSGKSNIADAIRWVLGEQSARALRGTKMEDVIFNGTESKRALGFCEVELIFDNTDGKLPIEFSEVSLARRVYRNGESEYLLCGSPVRLKDITELLRDTGIGKEGYSIIGQGKVEEILSNKSEDRRAAFEEAAGVMKYRARKDEAERKLEATCRNLVRLNDILSELGSQLEPLEAQSANARKFLSLREELKDIEINLFIQQYDKSIEKVNALTLAIEQFSDEAEKLNISVSVVNDACVEAEENERAVNLSITELQNRLISSTSDATKNSGESNLIRERIFAANKELEKTAERIEQNSSKLAELNNKSADSSNSAADFRVLYHEKEEKLSAITKRREELDKTVKNKENLIEERKASMIAALNRLADAKSRISRLEAIRETLVERLSTLESEYADAISGGVGLDSEREQALNAYNSLKSKVDSIQQKRKELITSINEANQTILISQESISKNEQTVESSLARINVLKEMKEAHEGYLSSVRRLFDDRKRNSQLKNSICGVVAELMRVPKEYETAIETSLNTSLQNIVTHTEEDAKFVIEYLRRNNYGRATMLPITVMRSRTLADDEFEACKDDGFIGMASDLIGFDEEYRGVFENLLGRTAIVRDIDAAIRISRKASASFRIATLKGDIIAPGGAMTGGSIQKREFTLLGREREINDLGVNLEKLKTQLEIDRKAIKNKRTETEAASRELEGLSKEYEKQNVELAKHEEKLDIINVYFDEKNAAIEKIELEKSRINDDIADIDAQCALAKNEQETLSTANVATDDEIKTEHKELMHLKTELISASDDETACRLELVSLEKEFKNLESETARLIKETDAVERMIANDRELKKKQEAEITALNLQLEDNNIKLQAGEEEVAKINKAISAKNKERENCEKRLFELRQKKETIAAQLASTQERSHKSELSLTKLKLEIANMTDKMWQDYELTYENALLLKKDISLSSATSRVGELRREMREIGDVNVASIEDYRTTKERFDALSLQYNDLTRAESDLRKLIGELMDAMKDEFAEKFELIQANFTRVFAELFGGGHAELVLSDKNDILNCDIDIVARPPGKKLQLLSLLSGGERALTAIALLFAILNLKPTAFCILDEIESSLDEANVSNFARYIKNYSSDTQFILITHRKGSMEVCNALYGVAMEEKGISKIVSAKFNENEVIQNG